MRSTYQQVESAACRHSAVFGPTAPDQSLHGPCTQCEHHHDPQHIGPLAGSACPTPGFHQTPSHAAKRSPYLLQPPAHAML